MTRERKIVHRGNPEGHTRSSLSDAINREAYGLPEGEILSAETFLHLANRAAVSRALAKLVRQTSLARICRGWYVIRITTRFGTRASSPSTVLECLAARTGDILVPHGAAAANALGLTTQVPMREIYLTSGRSRQLRFGAMVITIKHAPQWLVMFGNEPAGMAIRALHWSGPEHANKAVKKLRRTLTRTDWKRLRACGASLPQWMTCAIG